MVRRVVVLALLTAAPALMMPATASAIEATGLDAITTPGHPVEVRAKFERGGWAFWRPDVRDRAATVEALGQRHRVRTDREGLARVVVQPTAPGVYPITARLERRSRPPVVRGSECEPAARASGWIAPAASGHVPARSASARERRTTPTIATSRLFVLDPARPVAVVDIDGTISDLPDWQVPFVGHRAPTFAGAPALMADLARRFQIVYLTARDDLFDEGTRAFLARHGFPDGPIVYNDLGLRTPEERGQLDPHAHGEFKLGQLQALRARGVAVTIGIGNAETDAFAYEQAGLPSYILTTKAGAGPSFRFKRYADLRPRLVADGWLPATTGLAGALSGGAP